MHIMSLSNLILKFAFKKSLFFNVARRDYILIDTPGFSGLTSITVITDDETWKKIGSIVLRCASGIEAKFFLCLFVKGYFTLFETTLTPIFVFLSSDRNYTSSQEG